MVLGITRQVDVKPEVISLLKLLQDIKANKSIITKTWFANQYEKTLPRQIGEQHFTEHFGSGEDVDLKIIEQDIQELKSATAKVAKFRHTRIAHKNADERLVIDLNFKEVEGALKVLEKLMIKYQLLINQSGFAGLMPTITYDWEVVFRTPWIK